MNQLLIVLALFSSISVLANSSVKGIVMQSQCNRPFGLGVVEIQTRDGDTLVSSWYKVKSVDLCSTQINHQMFLGKTSKLAAISASNITFETNTISTFTLNNDGFIIALSDNKAIASADFFTGVDSYEQTGNRDAHDWYFSETLTR